MMCATGCEDQIFLDPESNTHCWLREFLDALRNCGAARDGRKGVPDAVTARRTTKTNSHPKKTREHALFS